LDFILYNYLSGREGQTMNISVKKNNIPKLLKTYLYEMEFIKKHYDVIIDRSNLYRIMASDSIYLLNMLVYQSWREFKRDITKCKQYFHTENTKWDTSKQAKRYKNYPLFFFFITEKLRQFKNHD
jgi:hypothetical protein